VPFGTGIYPCPLPECVWTLSDRVLADVSLRVDPQTAATAMAPGPYREAARARVEEAITRVSLESGEALEREVRAHLESHDVLDFLRAIRLLEQRVAQYDSGIRPHRYPGADEAGEVR
jgi:hypothetical protein